MRLYTVTVTHIGLCLAESEAEAEKMAHKIQKGDPLPIVKVDLGITAEALEMDPEDYVWHQHGALMTVAKAIKQDARSEDYL